MSNPFYFTNEETEARIGEMTFTLSDVKEEQELSSSLKSQTRVLPSIQRQ